MRCWHVTFATDDRFPLLSGPSQVLRCIRLVARIARERLVLFLLVDDHLHVILVCTRQELGRVRRALWQGLAAIVDRPLAPPRTRTIEHRGHLRNTLGYLLRQTEHHGLAVHPALWTGSCFADLVGARCIRGMRLALFDQLPRLDPAEVYRDVELEPVRPATAPEVRAAGARRLVDACFAAVGVHPGDTSPRGEVLGARSAAASLGRRAGLGNGELEWALGASPRTLRRLAKMPPDIAVQRAALLQIEITDALQRPVASSRGA